jgi:superfamily II DNA or RNA helicase
MLGNINQQEKTLVFCANQAHAAMVRDIINQEVKVKKTDYCVRVTANDGAIGDTYLKQFQDNDKTIPTIITTSQKLTTGVDARNVRNVVLMRPVNSMIEFKQIIGRGTRLFEGKHYFTIVDFVNAYHLFSDAEWDGEPIEPEEPSSPKPPTKPIEPKDPKEDDGEEKKGREWYARFPFKYSGVVDLSQVKNNFVTPEKKFSSLPPRFELKFNAEIRNYQNNKIITFSATNYTGSKEKRRRLDDNSIFQCNY